MPALKISDLHVSFGSSEILRGISLDVEPGETLGVLGESGCGKSLTGLAAMRLLPPGGTITQGTIELQGKQLTKISESQMRRIRGGEIAMVFQDPFTCLNPMMRIGDQIAEAIDLHQRVGSKRAKTKAIEQLESVRVPAPESAARKFPHQLSGGQRQRVMIAMAFSCHPKVLIADEPTTALDVTLQAQILALLKELQSQEGTAVILISHDVGVIAGVADRIAVFYAGKVIETGSAGQIIKSPAHPYTQGLLASMPGESAKLYSIPGQPPRFTELPIGCSFAPRCKFQFEKCELEPGLIAANNTLAACWLQEGTNA